MHLLSHIKMRGGCFPFELVGINIYKKREMWLKLVRKSTSLSPWMRLFFLFFNKYYDDWYEKLPFIWIELCECIDVGLCIHWFEIHRQTPRRGRGLNKIKSQYVWWSKKCIHWQIWFFCYLRRVLLDMCRMYAVELPCTTFTPSSITSIKCGEKFRDAHIYTRI